ncbi:hypothetical protein [uncultured Clostridium sp.]|jgi:hypothetical protein|uniref:hypothetical protein n=1 Tax=uncultured Clostridium sp. TaxID=59620 RepID=UPI002608637D|nr:hypothetical protein [uncultured Clostridium sp.]
MFGSDILKDYYVIFFDFKINKYFVYKYLRNRKLTGRQRWDMIYKNEYSPKIIASGEVVSARKYEELIESLKLPSKRCERNMTFDI